MSGRDGHVDADKADAIRKASDAVMAGEHDDQFLVDVLKKQFKHCQLEQLHSFRRFRCAGFSYCGAMVFPDLLAEKR